MCFIHVCLLDLLAEHLQEIRALRQRLEESIRTNDRLREQLERRLAEVEKDPGTHQKTVFDYLGSFVSTCPTCVCAMFSSHQHLHPRQRGAGSADSGGTIPLGTKPNSEGTAQHGIQRYRSSYVWLKIT